MDVDRMRGKSSPAVICFQCQKPGNYSQECPQAFDIRSMTTEEKLELLPEFLALADVNGAPPMEDGPGGSEYDTPEAEEVSDFVTCSR